MPYLVRRVSSRRMMRDFLDLPARIYRGDPNYVPPLKAEVRRTLDAARNPYFTGARLRLFVCYDHGSAVARTAVVIQPRHEEKFGVRAAFFGFFESIDDSGAAGALFDAVQRFCRQQGIAVLEGPFNPNHYSELGLLLDSYDRRPVFFQAYNPSYYPALLEGIGFRISASLFTARNDRAGEFAREQFDLEAPLAVPDGFTVRQPDMHRLREEMETIRSIFNDAFASNWHFLPASKDEYDFSVKFLNLITRPDLVSIVEYRGEPAGVAMFVLDVNPLLQQFHGRRGPLKLLRFLRKRAELRTVVLYAAGIRQAFRHSRASSLLWEICARTISKFDAVEATWISEENLLARRSAERLGMRPDRHFGIYALPVPAATQARPIAGTCFFSPGRSANVKTTEGVLEAYHGQNF